MFGRVDDEMDRSATVGRAMNAHAGHRDRRVWIGDLTCPEGRGTIPRVAVVLERMRRRPVGSLMWIFVGLRAFWPLISVDPWNTRHVGLRGIAQLVERRSPKP